MLELTEQMKICASYYRGKIQLYITLIAVGLPLIVAVASLVFGTDFIKTAPQTTKDAMANPSIMSLTITSVSTYQAIIYRQKERTIVKKLTSKVNDDRFAKRFTDFHDSLDKTIIEQFHQKTKRSKTKKLNLRLNL